MSHHEKLRTSFHPKAPKNLPLTRGVRARDVPVGSCSYEVLPGAAQPPAVEEDGQVHDVPHVVVPVDVRVPEHAAEVLVDRLYDDVRVTCKNGNKRAF